MGNEPRKITTVNLTRRNHRQLKVAASLLNLTMAEVISSALEDYFEKHDIPDWVPGSKGILE